MTHNKFKTPKFFKM